VEYAEAAEEREPWDLPAAYEAVARAYLAAGDRRAAGEWKARAQAQLVQVQDADDREPIEQDLASLDVD
jgi:hypothetical protein